MRLFKGATCAPTLEVISAPARDGVRLAKCLPAEGGGVTCRGCDCGQVFAGGNPEKGARKWSYAMSEGLDD